MLCFPDVSKDGVYTMICIACDQPFDGKKHTIGHGETDCPYCGVWQKIPFARVSSHRVTTTPAGRAFIRLLENLNHHPGCQCKRCVIEKEAGTLSKMNAIRTARWQA